MLCILPKEWPLGCHKHQGNNLNTHPNIIHETNYKPDVNNQTLTRNTKYSFFKGSHYQQNRYYDQNNEKSSNY